MRILTVADVPPDPDRGAAGTEVQTVRALRAMGHEVDSLWNDALGRRIAHGNLHLLFELPDAYERVIVESLSRTTYDVVHVNQPQGYRAARTVHRISPGTVFIHRSHGFEMNVSETLDRWRPRFDDDKRNTLRRVASSAMQQLLARHGSAVARAADGHIVSSSDDADFLHTRLAVPRERIAVVPQAPPDLYVTTPALPLTSERLRRVLYVGQFAFFKAPMIVAAAMNRLDETIECTWVCDRASHDKVRALLTRPVEMLDWMSQEALRDVYDRHGIFLFPSFYEGFGKVFLEAMSRGLCVVASDAGGMRDVITSWRDGVLVPPGDSAALADAADALIADSGWAASIGAAAAATARLYSWERVAGEIADFYRQCAEMRQG